MKRWRLALVALLPALVMALAVEVVSRTEHVLRKGYSYAESLAYVPHDELVFHNNPRKYEWRRVPGRRLDFFFIRPLATDDRAPRIWVFGGSTSAAQPDGTDWPALFETLLSEGGGAPVRVVNMGHGGYGIGHIRWLYRHYREKVRPAAIIVFSGWNYRGIVSSPVFSYRPVNACSRFDGPLPCISAFLINHSAAYGRAVHLYGKLRSAALTPYNPHLWVRSDQCAPPPPYPELAEWEQEYRETIAAMAREYRLFLVLFPGLAMRDDVRPELSGGLRCIAEQFELRRIEYEQRLTAIRHIGQELGLPLLDARGPYLRLSPRVHVSYFTDLAHQTPEGNRLLAQAIYAEFVRSTR